MTKELQRHMIVKVTDMCLPNSMRVYDKLFSVVYNM